MTGNVQTPVKGIMHKTIRSSISDAFYTGIKVFGQNPKGVRVLAYHRVNDESADYVTVSANNFRAQMAYLAEHGYRTVSLFDLIKGRTEPKDIVITFDDGFEDNYSQAFPIMKQFGFTATHFLIVDQIGADGYLSFDQIQEMRRAGFEFGSHTLSHPVLKGLERIKKWDEILGSKERLEDLLNDECRFFCYPKGIYDEEAFDMVSEAGYEGACCNHPGMNLAGMIEPNLIKRTEIAHGDSLHDFKKKLAGAYDLMHRTLHLLRGKP